MGFNKNERECNRVNLYFFYFLVHLKNINRDYWPLRLNGFLLVFEHELMLQNLR